MFKPTHFDKHEKREVELLSWDVPNDSFKALVTVENGGFYFPLACNLVSLPEDKKLDDKYWHEVLKQ